MDRIGKYEILSELGHGGMGVVYKGRDAIIDREVAIKVILERAALKDPMVKKRFYREARSAGRLAHPNITTIYEVGEEDEKPYLVMEYLEGDDLRSALKAGTTLTIQEKIDIAIQICSGLNYAHQHEVVHRDIKPENIRLLTNGNIKIMDFGIARIQSEATVITQANVSMGTPRYMSPEQVKGETADHQADIFSFGVLFYELLAGEEPFSGENVTTLIYKILNATPKPLNIQPPALGAALQAIVSKCLAKDKKHRYYSCAEVIRDLKALSRIKENGQANGRDSGHVAAAPPVQPVARQDTPPAPAPHVPTPVSPVAPQPTPVGVAPKRSRAGLWTFIIFVLVVGSVVAAYVVFQREADEMIAEVVSDLELFQPEVAAMDVTPTSATIDVGGRVQLKVEMRDAEGAMIGAQDVSATTVQWRVADSTIVQAVAGITPDRTTLGAAITGLSPGRTAVMAVADDVVESVIIEVAIPDEDLETAVQKHEEARALLQVDSLSNEAVLAAFEDVRDTFGYALDAERNAVIEKAIEDLSAEISSYDEILEQDSSATLILTEQRALWQGYLDGAFRISPSTAQATQRIAEIDDLVRRTATLEEETLVTCDSAVEGGSTGALRICRDGAIGDAFAQGASVYLNARVNSPRRATIRWEWLGPDGAPRKQNRTSVMGAQGYRVWDILSSSEAQDVGEYQLRVYNGQDALIGYRTFSISAQ